MTDSDHIPQLDKKGLRDFGLTTGAIVAALFGLVLPFVFGRPWPVWPWVIAVPLVLTGLIAPSILGPLYRGWMRFGLLLSKITTPLILGIVYFLVISPIAFFRRLQHRDALKRSLDKSMRTYREAGVQKPPSHFERPF
jgi:hypothetical protein